MDLELLLPLLIRGAQTIIDGVVDGSKLNITGQKIVQGAYGLAVIVGDDAVRSTETTLDGQGLDAFKSLCEDTSKEGQFPLPALVMIED